MIRFCFLFSSPGAPQTLPEGLGEADANRPVDQAPSGLQSSLGQRSASNFCKAQQLYLERSKQQNVFCAALLLDSHV